MVIKIHNGFLFVSHRPAMRVLSWNVHGLGDPHGIRAFLELLRRKDLDLFFLQETKIRSNYFMSKLMYFGFHNGIVMDCMGKSGGLALMQKLDFEL